MKEGMKKRGDMLGGCSWKGLGRGGMEREERSWEGE